MAASKWGRVVEAARYRGGNLVSLACTHARAHHREPVWVAEREAPMASVVGMGEESGHKAEPKLDRCRSCGAATEVGLPCFHCLFGRDVTADQD
jgi:hypothetical protein